MTDSQRWQMFRDLLGHVADGSSSSVTVSEDDATYNWCVKVGRHVFYSPSLDEALRLAHEKVI